MKAQDSERENEGGGLLTKRFGLAFAPKKTSRVRVYIMYSV